VNLIQPWFITISPLRWSRRAKRIHVIEYSSSFGCSLLGAWQADSPSLFSSWPVVVGATPAGCRPLLNSRDAWSLILCRQAPTRTSQSKEWMKATIRANECSH
jgi:hypothetical protein